MKCFLLCLLYYSTIFQLNLITYQKQSNYSLLLSCVSHFIVILSLKIFYTSFLRSNQFVCARWLNFISIHCFENKKFKLKLCQHADSSIIRIIYIKFYFRILTVHQRFKVLQKLNITRLYHI